MKTKPRRPVHVNIRRLRCELGLTQPQLAAAVGVDKTTISHWERGALTPTVERLPSVARKLGVTVDELLAAHRRGSS